MYKKIIFDLLSAIAAFAFVSDYKFISFIILPVLLFMHYKYKIHVPHETADHIYDPSYSNYPGNIYRSTKID
ncbi:hypothetical protein NOVO_09165 (plasmid) [Rickettsiales bacterium Ac37b]|nr:hypothetical protein NOVO_09165 [Rickettsiales bacterium Ac37b]